MREVCLLLIFMVGVFLFPVSLYAQQVQDSPKTILDYQAELKLSDTQVKEIKNYIYDFEKKAKELQRRLVSLKQEIASLLEKEGDFNVIKKKVREYHETLAELEIANLETGRNIKHVLTAEQFKKWKEIVKSRK